MTRLICLVLVCLVSAARAHEVRPAYLEIRQTSADAYDVLWKVPALGDRRLGVYVEFPTDVVATSEPRAFMAGGAHVERWSVTCAGGLDGRSIRIAGLEATRIDVLARIVHEGGAVQVVRVYPSDPVFTVDESPSAWGVVTSFTILGVEHILLGVDHLLFVLVLVLIIKGKRRLIETVTTFTIAHSITLAAATLGVLSVPAPPVEACIALSIVFVAAEVVHARQGSPSLTERAPWVVAFVFGLLHGLGFAGALSEVGLPQQSIPLALLFFNVGVELGQIAFILVVLGLIAAAGRLAIKTPSWSWRVAPYAIGITAMFWVFERLAGFGSA